MKLVQKEKQVVQLQAEVERLRAQDPTAKNRDAEERRRERDRLKWNKLSEERADLKTKVDIRFWIIETRPHIPSECGIRNRSGLESEGDALPQAGTRVRLLSFLEQYTGTFYRASREGVRD